MLNHSFSLQQQQVHQPHKMSGNLGGSFNNRLGDGGGSCGVAVRLQPLVVSVEALARVLPAEQVGVSEVE